MLDNFREWLSDNLRYILLGLAVVLMAVIIFCIVRLVSGGGGKTPTQDSSTAAQSSADVEVTALEETEAQPAQAAQDTTVDTAAVTGTETPEALVKDSSDILTLVTKYYNAAVQKDEETLSGIVSPWNDTVKGSIFENNIVESYNNISTYSKTGPEDGTYVVYVYYEGKLEGYDTLVPSLSMLYLFTDADGTLKVGDRNADPEIAGYVSSISLDDDVQALIQDVNEKYASAIASDPELDAFMSSYRNESGEEEQETEGVAGEMRAMYDLNIRESPSTESAILGAGYTGTTITVLEDAGDGWVKISSDASGSVIEGYVRYEYLADVE